MGVWLLLLLPTPTIPNSCGVSLIVDCNHSPASSFCFTSAEFSSNLRFTSAGLSQTYTGWLIVTSVVGHAPTGGTDNGDNLRWRHVDCGTVWPSERHEKI